MLVVVKWYLGLHESIRELLVRWYVVYCHLIGGREMINESLQYIPKRLVGFQVQEWPLQSARLRCCVEQWEGMGLKGGDNPKFSLTKRVHASCSGQVMM